MKKIIAVILACLMVFSVAVIPAGAAEERADTIVVVENPELKGTTIYTSLSVLLVGLVDNFHKIVHQLLGVVKITCIMCNGEDLSANEPLKLF